MKNYFLAAVVALATLLSFTSCDKEEEIALTMSGTWETTSVLFPRTYKGQAMNPVKTIFQFDHDHDGATVGYGVAVEYFSNPDFPAAYYHFRWSTWTRQSGDVGIEVKYQETTDVFSVMEPDYDLRDSEWFGQCTINQIPGTQSFRFVRGTAPDVSKVKIWGYNELIPTWKPITYSGVLDVRREYKGVTYKPTQVTITFDAEPQYNDCIVGYEKAYVKEEYSDAPWGSYLADSIRHWSFSSSKDMTIYFANSDDSWGDYRMWDVTATADSLVGDFLVKTNVFTHFNLKRVTNPDWSTITEWGILNRLQE